MEFQYIKVSVSDHICTLKINNPSQLNSLNTKLLKELDSAVSRIENDREIYVVIITGEGKAFVAGADITEMAGLDSRGGSEFGKLGSDLFRRIERLPVPVIAAVNGYALGGGCELALACDIRIASEYAKFGQPETGLGITPGFSGTYRLPKIVGIAKAKELIYTGMIIDAQEALRIGLVNSVIKSEELMDKVNSMAGEIASRAPIAVRNSKKAMEEGMDMESMDAIRNETNLFGECFDTVDQKEGMNAFISKRKAEFKNR
ncbi:MAG: enoyl-CoA hydratase-related protein [Bacteroidales bacterium]|nr:enoyl-CoA hydratase-related protein [Bacteroidales bacterium]MDD2425655.1 enoyl-CoA hydratase-related protein [Bacteroidales bacterium]MDD3990207.1 enoyl-CoA hydratase-related protein [Bacteroidales bacterium]MDD4638721.1 enoyl-CoA hydratase-related protein [Bacteroidales bacterium]